MAPCHLQIKNYSKMEKLLALIVLFFGCVSFVLFVSLLAIKHDSGICFTSECIQASHHILSTVDSTVNPCEDFYQFACGHFLKTAISHNQPYALHHLKERIDNQLNQIIMDNVENEENLTTSFKYQRKFFRACLNTTAINEDNDKTFLDNLKYVVGGWPLAQGYTEDLSWPEVMVKARTKGIKFDFFLDVDTHIDYKARRVYLQIDLPSSTDQSFDIIWQEKNIETILKMADIWGSPTMSATWEIRKTIEFANHFKQILKKAHKANENTTLNEQNMTIYKLKNIQFLKVNWVEFLKNMTELENIQENDRVIFRARLDYVQDLYYLMQKTQTKFWANYIAILLIVDNYGLLSTKIQTICGLIVPTKYLSKNDFCFGYSRMKFRNVAEMQFIRKAVTIEKRNYIKEMIRNVKEQMRNSLNHNRWMDESTKNRALKYLENMTEAVGSSDSLYDEKNYEKLFGFLNFTSDNVMALNQEISKLNTDFKFYPLKNSTEFLINDITDSLILQVNAYYARDENLLMFSAPILQPPIYDQNRPEYLNFGALGSIIGHELTHAFQKMDESDSFLSEKEENDQFKWSNDTMEKYDQAVMCLVEEYDNYTAGLKKADHFNKNGTVTLNENLADFTGVTLAYTAYQNWVSQHGTEDQLPGIKLTPNQIYWIMSSTYYCYEPKVDEGKMYSRNVNHALAPFRVVGRVRNSPYFAKDFDCPVGAKMNPERKCRVFA